jgi:hypothetical protein
MPTLTVSTQVPSLLSDPTLSPFTAARPPTDTTSSDSSSTPREENNSDKPSSESPQADDPVLVAQLQHGLDIQGSEPENPLTPEEPAYLQLVEQAVEAGLNVPPPPPLVHPVHPLAPQLPALQPIIPIQQNIMATATNIETGHLRNDPPDLFRGDRSKLDQFKKEFKLWRGLNVNHEIMRSPYLHTMLILSLIKGPLVDNWTNDQINQLEEKVTCAVNPIGQDQKVLWNEFVAELDSHFANTTRKQKAYATLQDLHIRGNDFNSYTATFKYLAKQAGFTLTTDATIHLFALGLNPKLQTTIIARDHESATMDDWITATQTETCKVAKLQTFNQSGAKKYAWVHTPQPHHKEYNGHGRRHHPNDESVLIDVDPPIFVQIRCARTDDDIQHFKLEERCFQCDK